MESTSTLVRTSSVRDTIHTSSTAPAFSVHSRPLTRFDTSHSTISNMSILSPSSSLAPQSKSDADLARYLATSSDRGLSATSLGREASFPGGGPPGVSMVSSSFPDPYFDKPFSWSEEDSTKYKHHPTDSSVAVGLDVEASIPSTLVPPDYISYDNSYELSFYDFSLSHTPVADTSGPYRFPSQHITHSSFHQEQHHLSIGSTSQSFSEPFHDPALSTYLPVQDINGHNLTSHPPGFQHHPTDFLLQDENGYPLPPLTISSPESKDSPSVFDSAPPNNEERFVNLSDLTAPSFHHDQPDHEKKRKRSNSRSSIASLSFSGRGRGRLSSRARPKTPSRSQASELADRHRVTNLTRAHPSRRSRAQGASVTTSKRAFSKGKSPLGFRVGRRHGRSSMVKLESPGLSDNSSDAPLESDADNSDRDSMYQPSPSPSSGKNFHVARGSLKSEDDDFVFAASVNGHERDKGKSKRSGQKAGLALLSPSPIGGGGGTGQFRDRDPRTHHLLSPFGVDNMRRDSGAEDGSGSDLDGRTSGGYQGQQSIEGDHTGIMTQDVASSAYADSEGSVTASGRRRKNKSIPLPIPVPNLTKKSRGRKVPSFPDRSIYDNGSDEGNDLTTSGSRKYMCIVPECGKGFVRGEHLKRHVRSIHTYEKPHPCPHSGCSKSFSRRDNLRQHVRIHRR